MRYVTEALDFLFGCHHRNLSRVFTIGGHSYRVCCDCAASFDYSLDTMSIQKRAFPLPEPAASVAQLRSAQS
jgi:uncharacterized membrane protein